MEFTPHNILIVALGILCFVALFLTKRRSDKILNKWREEMENDLTKNQNNNI